MRKPRHAAPASPLADALAQVGDRWTLLVVAALLEGPKRFNELQEELRRDRAQRALRAASRRSPSTR